MCGIAGKSGSLSLSYIDTVKRITECLAHRGPDAAGIKRLDEKTVFGHRRLSIIDLTESANQPMVDRSGRYAIVYNGEVYNYKDLKELLKQKGYIFLTESDTEVVLNSFVEWGVNCFDKFNGMFAIAIWDSQKKELILARDRFGKKPLYYCILDDEITFASELTALLADEKIRNSTSLSIEGVNHYLALGYIISPNTIYNEILKLEPATYLIFCEGREIKKQCYWHYDDCFRKEKTHNNEDKIIDELDYRLTEAVRRRLISDVPVGAFLSGGLDSSGICFYAKHQMNYHLHTFNAGFNEVTYDESSDAKKISEFLNTVHHHVSLNQKKGKQFIESSISYYDEPFSDTSLVPMLLVSKLASEHVKVVLSGDGADEIFCGYLTYRADAIRKKFAILPPIIRELLSTVLRRTPYDKQKKTSFGFKLRQFSKGINKNKEYAHYAWRELYDENERIHMIGRDYENIIKETNPFFLFERHYKAVQDLESVNQHLYVDAKTWLADDILVKVDRATMAFGLEARAPYLDIDLVKLAASMPVRLKLSPKGGKYILKKLLKKYLPESTTTKRKSGFNAPINTWLENSHDNEFRVFNKYVLCQKGILA